MQISVAYDFIPKQNSVAASQVMDHFGISFEQGRHVIADGLELPIEPGQVVLFTGASGSGKSSLMRAAARELARVPVSAVASSLDLERETRGEGERGTSEAGALTSSLPLFSPSPFRSQKPAPHPVLHLDDLALPPALLIDSLPLPAAEAMQLLATCGLGEAHLMLRTPAELSDGQRYRFRLALALSQKPNWVVADEFTATLDRTLAKVIAFNIRRLTDRTGVGFLLATTHEDVAEDLRPDVQVRCRLDREVRVERRSRDFDSAEEQRGRGAEGKGQDLSLVNGQFSLGHCTSALADLDCINRPMTNDNSRMTNRPQSDSLSHNPSLPPLLRTSAHLPLFRTRAKKKKHARRSPPHLLPPRPLALPRDPSRLAVLRSVALPQPSHRARPAGDAAVAQ